MIEQIKKEIGYTEKESPKCKNCVHHSEEDGVIDRSWVIKCNLIKAVKTFTVEPNALCDKFEPISK